MAEKNLVRVNKNNPCPVCDHPDWCYFIEDNVVCMRIPSAHPKKSAEGYGGYVHYLNDDIRKRIIAAPSVVNNNTRASLDKRHKVYKDMLKMPEMQLTTQDYKMLSKWGINVNMAKRRGYRRLPGKGRAGIAQRLINSGHSLEGIPGFFFKDEGYWTFTTSPGIIFPCLSPKGKIQGFQVRQDNSETHKYKWFSSSYKPYGVSSGAPWHVAYPSRVKVKALYITEGFKKADLISEYLGAITIGIAGVNSYKGVPEFVADTNRPAVIAFDMDVLEKHEVFMAFKKLITLINNDVYTAAWDPAYKGLDDLLVADGNFKVFPVNIVMKKLEKKTKKTQKA